MKSSELKTEKLVLSSLMLALCYILPNFTGNIPVVGSMLLPMHLPVFLCGFLCGPFWSAGIGFIAPVSRSILYSMPPMIVAIPMGFELAAYGFVSGFLFQHCKKRGLPLIGSIYVSLVSAMVLGRVLYGIIKAVITMGSGDPYTFSAFIAGTVTSSIPGIVLQLILVPVVVMAVERQQKFPVKG